MNDFETDKTKPEEYGTNIIPFAPRTQAAGNEPPGVGNWLGRMVAGTRFLAKRKGMSGSEVDDFIVSTDPATMPVVLLAKNINGRDGVFAWHDPIIFCKDHTFYMTLEVLEPKDKDGNSHKVPTEPMAGDVKFKDIDSLHEKE